MVKKNVESEFDNRDNSINSLSGELSKIIKLTPGIAIIIYSIFYIVGYFYLFSYYNFWGLSTIDLNYSIFEYATIAIYPVVLAGGSFVISLSIRYYLCDLTLKQTEKKILRIRLKVFSNLILPLTIFVILISMFFVNASLALIIISMMVFVGYQMGIIFFKMFKNKGQKKNRSPVILRLITPSILVLLILVMSSSYLGINNAMQKKSSLWGIFSAPDNLTKVEIRLNEKNNELSVFKGEGDKYVGLLLLVFRDNVYYFIADQDEIINRLDATYGKIYQLKKEIEEIKVEIAEEESMIYKSVLNDDLKDLTMRHKQLLESLKELHNTVSKTYAIKIEQIKYLNYISSVLHPFVQVISMEFQ